MPTGLKGPALTTMNGAPAVSQAASARVNLLGLPAQELQSLVGTLGSRPFRARQLMNWLYKRGVAEIDQMTDLARDFRTQLAQVAEVKLPEIVLAQQSLDGTRKWLLRADASQAFEMVYIPEAARGTLCISSQVGCVLDCSFCATARQGFNRNLTTAEIIGQVWLANRELGFEPGGERRNYQCGVHGHGRAARQFSPRGAGNADPAR